MLRQVICWQLFNGEIYSPAKCVVFLTKFSLFLDKRSVSWKETRHTQYTRRLISSQVREDVVSMLATVFQGMPFSVFVKSWPDFWRDIENLIETRKLLEWNNAVRRYRELVTKIEWQRNHSFSGQRSWRQWWRKWFITSVLARHYKKKNQSQWTIKYKPANIDCLPLGYILNPFALRHFSKKY